MRDRLIKLIAKIKNSDEYSWNPSSSERDAIMADKLLANGVIVPPCKVGQTVYKFNRYNKTIIDECRIRSILQREDGSLKINVIDLRYLNCFEILPDANGKTVFLTKEEAEAKLKEGVQG